VNRDIKSGVIGLKVLLIHPSIQRGEGGLKKLLSPSGGEDEGEGEVRTGE